jgi:hypothetical protein
MTSVVQNDPPIRGGGAGGRTINPSVPSTGGWRETVNENSSALLRACPPFFVIIRIKIVRKHVHAVLNYGQCRIARMYSQGNSATGVNDLCFQLHVLTTGDIHLSMPITSIALLLGCVSPPLLPMPAPVCDLAIDLVFRVGC